METSDRRRGVDIAVLNSLPQYFARSTQPKDYTPELKVLFLLLSSLPFDIIIVMSSTIGPKDDKCDHLGGFLRANNEDLNGRQES